MLADVLKEINIRHDRSGSYPQSALEYPGEKTLANLARVPLDDKYRHLSTPFREPMDLH